jgi:hypothetical protein
MQLRPKGFRAKGKGAMKAAEGPKILKKIEVLPKVTCIGIIFPGGHQLGHGYLTRVG